jgi:predicted RNase H-like HicB family nuclease
MYLDYMTAALRDHQLELMENGQCFGYIPSCPGVWADADTKQECLIGLVQALHHWVRVGLENGHELPVLDGISLADGDLVFDEEQTDESQLACNDLMDRDDEEPQRGEASQPGASDAGALPQEDSTLDREPCRGETYSVMVHSDGRRIVVPTGDPDKEIQGCVLERLTELTGFNFLDDSWDEPAETALRT